MASARKKQDEKNLKSLRELVSLQHNKHCFDCNQRGPTYVNVTIGSFVCTKCSGMLRGLTPPHRVKSISMATFSPEEIELVKNRGNDYCQKVWLGLYEGKKPSDEFGVHTLMLDKYERKRYYMEPSVALRNGYNNPKIEVTSKPQPHPEIKTSFENDTNKKTTMSKLSNGKNCTTFNGGHAEFVADFAHADIFNAANNNSSTISQPQQQVSFANFDNNPVFNNENIQPQQIANNINGLNNGVMSTLQQQLAVNKTNGPPPPSVDRYAALKDLDNELKSQSTLDWNSVGSNSSLYSSPTTPGSFYSSTASPQSSSYGSPSQGQFMNLFPPTNESPTVNNPFNAVNGTNGLWTSFNGNPNPFRATPSPDYFSNLNGSDNHQFASPIINGTNWAPNPFKVKVTNGNSSNPFL